MQTEQKINDRLWTNKAKSLTPYIPGEQPVHDNLCKLNTNENPFSPSPQVADAISNALVNKGDKLRLYPSAESDELRAALAEYYQLSLNQVFVGNGSDEVLAFVFACFFIKERPLLAPDIGYSFYPVYAEAFAVNLVPIPLTKNFTINPDDYRMPCSGIIIANPNAPTGLLLALSDIKKLAEEHPNAVIVIDEAYIDFAQSDDGDNVSAVSLINDIDNLLVTQTFSKSRALAGLRVGMAFGNASLIEALTRMKNSFNSYPLDYLAQIGAKASLLDVAYFETMRDKVISLRETLTTALIKLNFEVLPSQANFVFAKPASGAAFEIAQRLREQGIIVRHFDKPRLSEYLRISVGSDEQIEHLINALKAMDIL